LDITRVEPIIISNQELAPSDNELEDTDAHGDGGTATVSAKTIAWSLSEHLFFPPERGAQSRKKVRLMGCAVARH